MTAQQTQMPNNSSESGQVRPVLSAAKPPVGPLNGIVITDLTRILAGPYCTLLLHDLGAQIIKVERPEVGDDSRAIGPFLNGKSAYFASANRGKASITLDLKTEADKDLFEKILTGTDVLIENYRPGTMEKFGLGWEQLKDRFPKLIYAAVSGFGQTGPYADKPAYDLIVQAMGGLMSLTGHDGTPPTRVGTSIGDLAAGVFAALGIVTAIHDRSRTGRGQLVDVSMLDCQVALLENAIARFAVTGQAPGAIGNRHPSITPFQAFEVADGYVVVAAGNDRLFHQMCDAIGRADLKADSRFETNDSRCEYVNELKVEIETALKPHTIEHWLEVLQEAGVPCGPINTVDRVLSDPQVRARNMVVQATALGGEPIELAGNPVKLSGYEDPTSRIAPPQLDGDREAILDWVTKLGNN